MEIEQPDIFEGVKTCEKNNIKPDYVLGISMGSIVGAYYALNNGIEKIEDKLYSR